MPIKLELRKRTSTTYDDLFYVKTDWSIVENKPTTFTPTAHIHDSEDVADNSRTLEDIISWFDNIMSAGRMWGGRVTSNGDGTVTVAAGGGISKADSTDPTSYSPSSLNTGNGSRPSYVTWAETIITPTDNAYNFIYYDKTTNTITVTTDIDLIDYTQDFTVGRVYRMGTEVVIRWCGMNIWNFMRRVQTHGEEIERIAVSKGGLILGYTNLNINYNSGVIWAEGIVRFEIDAFDSSGTDTFSYWYRDGTGGHTRVTGQTSINNTQYDDGSGTLATLANNKYGVHWVYTDHTGGVHVIYGTGSYSLSEAYATTAPSDIPGLVDSYGTLLGRAIVEKSATDLTDIQSAFETTFAGSATSLHNELSNRDLADSHPMSAITDLVTTLASKYSPTNLPSMSTLGGRTQAEITAEITAAVDALINGAPGALDTINELAAALGDDSDFANTIANQLALKFDKAGGTITGDVVINGGSGGAGIGRIYGGTDGNDYIEIDGAAGDYIKHIINGAEILKSDTTGVKVATGKVLTVGGVNVELEGHTHTESEITDLGNYEPSFTKNTAFNKAFGVLHGTVCEGDDSRLSDTRDPNSHTHTESEITDLGSYALASHAHSWSQITDKPSTYDTDINTSGYNIIDNIYITDGCITSMASRSLDSLKTYHKTETIHFWKGTQTAYDALTKDSNTIYFIVG